MVLIDSPLLDSSLLILCDIYFKLHHEESEILDKVAILNRMCFF